MSMNQLLRQFYGLDNAKGSDPTDINGTGFKAEPFFNSLVTTKNLEQITRDYNQLESEILSLDSDLQTLVYNNYTKFIQAAETVSSMKSGLSSLSSQMKNLLNGLSIVSEQAAEIRKDLNPNREKISRLVGVSRLLERIDFISRLPVKLRAHVNAGNYETAVDIWMAAEKVIETQTYPSFVRIRDECMSIVEELKIRVRAKMIDETTSSSEAVSCAETLIKLQLPVDATLEEMMKVRMKVACDAIDAFTKKDDVFQQLNDLRGHLVRHIMSFIDNYNERLLKHSTLIPNANSREDPMDNLMRTYRTELFKKLVKLFTQEQIYALSSESFGNFLDEFANIVGPVGLFQQRNSFSQWIVQKFVQSRFDKLYNLTLNSVTEGDPATRVDIVLNEIAKQFKTECAQLVQEFEGLVSKQNDSKHLIIQGMSKVLARILDSLRKCDSRYALITFSICHCFSVRIIPYAYELVARFDKQSPLLKMEANMQEDATMAARECLKQYIHSKRSMLSEFIAQGMTTTDWLEAKTPHDVSMFIHLVIEELAMIWAQVDSVIDRIKGGDDRSSQSSLSSRNRFSGFAALGSSQSPLFHGLREDNIHQIDRLFTTVNRLHLGMQAEFDSKSILTRIAMYTIKTLLEYVRQYTFSCTGFNQMQVDSYFIYMTIFDKVEEPSLMNALIEEVLSSAAERTIDPIPFKLVVLSDIYSRSESKPQTRE